MSASRWWRLQLGIGVVLLSAVLYLYLGNTGWEEWSIGSWNIWCEHRRAGLIREPSNSWTSLAYVVVGLYLLRSTGDLKGERENPLKQQSYANAVYATSAVLTGLGSFAMHGSNTQLGVYADTSAMMLIFSFPALYTYSRLRGWSDVRFGIMAIIVNSLLIASQAIYWGEGIRIAMLGIWLALEVVLRYRDRFVLIFIVPTFCDALLAPIDNQLFVRIALYAILAVLFSKMECVEIRRKASPWLGLVILTFLLAHAFWRMGMEGGVLCHPHSLLQGHAAWHILSALSILFLYLYFASETSPALEAE